MKLTLSKTIANQLVEDIVINKKYKIGDTLPTEEQLCKQYQASRTTIREALKILTSLNLIQTAPRKGSVVINNQTFLELNNLNFNINSSDFHEFRVMIESTSIFFACERIQADELKHIESLINMLDTSLSNPEFIELEKQLHSSFIKASHNSIFISFIPIICNVIDLAINNPHDQLNDDIILEYKYILKCIFNRDQLGAYNALRHHLLNNI
ncbi:MAG: GntR family transcriptional regulator [Erysipelotrichaceae bacterium]|nr:GntR family transcriptional regulator [Erysipelotrichaceae bacterium]MDY5251277.1 GntR family transcriptional regulator [Erysipelotrichaceae bacterium]